MSRHLLPARACAAARPRSRRPATPRACGRRASVRACSLIDGPRNPPTSPQPSPISAPCGGEDAANVHLPERSPRAGRHAELEPGDRPARTDDPRQLAQRGGRVVDVAQEVGERERRRTRRRRTAGCSRCPRRARRGRSGGGEPPRASRGSGRARPPCSPSAARARARPPRCRSPRRVPAAPGRGRRARRGSVASVDPGRTTAARRNGRTSGRAARRGLGPGRAGPQGESRGGAPRVRR